MPFGNQGNGDRRDSQEERKPKGWLTSATDEEVRAHVESEGQKLRERSQTLSAEQEQALRVRGRRAQELLATHGHDPEDDEQNPDRIAFKVNVEKKQLRDAKETESKEYESDEEGRAYQSDKPEPQTRLRKSPTPEDPFRKAKKMVKTRTVIRQAEQRSDVDSPADEGVSQQPASSLSLRDTSEDALAPPHHAGRINHARLAEIRTQLRDARQENASEETPNGPVDEEASEQSSSSSDSSDTAEDEGPTRAQRARLAMIRQQVSEGRKTQEAPQDTPKSPANGESSQQPAPPAASNAVPEYASTPWPRAAHPDFSTLEGVRTMLREAEQRKSAPQKTANSSADGETSQQPTTSQETPKNKKDGEASQEPATPQNTPKSKKDVKASQQSTTSQKTAKSSTDGKATQQPVTPQNTPKSPTGREATQEKATAQETNRRTHVGASEQPATPVALNAAPEYNPSVSRRPMTINLPGRRLEDLCLPGLASSRYAGGTNMPQPEGLGLPGLAASRYADGTNTPQPSPVVEGTPSADEHNPFTGRRGPPSFGNIASPGLETFNAQNILGQGPADPTATPANRQLPPALAAMNDAVARFEAYRSPPPSPPEDSSRYESEGEDEDEDEDMTSDGDGDRGHAPIGNIPTLRVFSPTASPAESDHNGDQPDHRDMIDADYDSDVTLANPDEDELQRRMALHQLGAGHDADEDDEEAHIPNHGGRDLNYEASPPREPAFRARQPDSPLRLGHHRVVEPLRAPDPYQMLRTVRNSLLGPRNAMEGGGPCLGNYEVVVPANNPFGLDDEEAQRQAANPFYLLGRAMASVSHLFPRIDPEPCPPLQWPGVQPADAATVFGAQFRKPSGLGVTYTRSIEERGAAFISDFARDDLGFRGEREVTPPEGQRALFMRQARRNPVAWRVSPRVAKRVPQRAGPRSEKLIRNMAPGINRRNKPEKSPVEQKKPEENGERMLEDAETRRLSPEVAELCEADQELFREVVLETEARLDAGLEVSDFFVRFVGDRGRKRRGSYTRCAPTTESPVPSESDSVTADIPRPRCRHIRPRPANITYPSRPFSDLDPMPGPLRSLSPRPYSLRETTTQAILCFPQHLAREIKSGNIDLLCRVLMFSILIWICLVIIMGDGEDHGVHWYVAGGEPRMWQAGS